MVNNISTTIRGFYGLVRAASNTFNIFGTQKLYRWTRKELDWLVRPPVDDIAAVTPEKIEAFVVQSLQNKKFVPGLKEARQIMLANFFHFGTVPDEKDEENLMLIKSYCLQHGLMSAISFLFAKTTPADSPHLIVDFSGLKLARSEMKKLIEWFGLEFGNIALVDCSGVKKVIQWMGTYSEGIELNLHFEEGINETGAMMLLPTLASAGNLVSLNFAGIASFGRDDYVGNVITRYLPQILKSNIGLTSLNLGWNTIGVHGAKALGDALTWHPSLASLDISLCGIRPEGAKYIAEGLKLNKTLIYLNVGGAKVTTKCHGHEHVVHRTPNGIGSTGMKAICNALKENGETVLATLDLSACEIENYNVSTVAALIEKNSTLTALNLGWNGIGSAGAEIIRAALKQNSTLTSLNLKNNPIKESDFKDTNLVSILI